jgi:hypothetical protein
VDLVEEDRKKKEAYWIISKAVLKIFAGIAVGYFLVTYQDQIENFLKRLL